MSYKILITEPVTDDVIQKLEKRYEVDVGDHGDFNKEEDLIEAIRGYDALLPMLSNPVTKKVIEAGDSLKIIANYAVGYNNIDLEAAKKANIKVANTPGVLTESCADCTVALLLATVRKICEAQQYLRDGRFESWEPLGFLGMELNGKTLGILGMGRIGTAVARRARGFGLSIIYHNRSRITGKTEKELNADYTSSVEELAARSDILSLNCPLTKQTHHIIDEEILDIMPNHSILVNTARGAIVDEKALAEALHQKSIGGAGIDVFENEPEIHPELLTAPNCVITPHIASATRHTRKAIGMLAADAIMGVLEGDPPSSIPNLIDL